MQYSIYKDKKPKDKNKKIKKIFKDLKFELKEEIRKQETVQRVYPSLSSSVSCPPPSVTVSSSLDSIDS